MVDKAACSCHAGKAAPLHCGGVFPLIVQHVTHITAQQITQLSECVIAHHVPRAESLQSSLCKYLIFPQPISAIALIFQGLQYVDFVPDSRNSHHLVAILFSGEGAAYFQNPLFQHPHYTKIMLFSQVYIMHKNREYKGENIRFNFVYIAVLTYTGIKSII